nr:MAG TPA: Minor structural protein putative tail fiber [Caudoviricetes sp.]
MIEIKDISGRVKLSVSIETGSVRRFELMKEDYVNLVFSLSDPVQLEIGDNIDYEGSVFYVTGKTYPTFNVSTGGYDYSVRFDSHYYRWKNHILFYDRQGNKEASWSLTRAPEAHLSIVVSNLRSLGFRYNGKEYQAVVDSSVDAVAKLVQYDSTNIVDALTKIAEAWECEWWVEGDKIYIGRIERGDPVDLEIGRQVVSMPRSQSQDLFATRLYAFGSTRNIPSGYRKGESGTVVQGVVQKRLMLPKGTPYVDVVQGLTEDQIVEAVVIFDDIYPRKIGTITEVIPKEVTEEGEDGTSETFTVYRFKDSGLSFSEEYVLPGKELRVVFQTGPLSGMDFALRFNPEGLPEDDPEAQVFEVVRNDSYGQTLPESPLIPGTGNKYILYNFDTQYVSDTLIPQAEEELLRRTIEYKGKVVSDPSTYTCVLNSYYASGYDENNGILNPEKAIDLSVGQRVRLINKAYFENGRESRVLGFEKKLDIPYDSPSYTVGESAAYSRLGELERKLENIQYKDNTYVNQGSGSFGVYIIKKEDTTAASDENVFSALRTLYEINKVKQDNDKRYLRKDIPDIAHEDILFDKKIGSSIFLDGMDGKGWEIKADGSGIMEALKVRSDIYAGNKIGSISFAPGFTGWGTEIDIPTATGTFDNIFARKTFTAYEIVYSQIYGLGGNQIVSDINKIGRVERLSDRWRCYMDDMDGLMLMNLREGDGVRIQRRNGITSTKYLFGRCIGISSDYFDIAYPLIEGTGEPEAGDFAMRWGNDRDTTRQGLIYLTSADQGAPFIAVYDGITGVSTQDTLKAQLGNLSMIRTKNGTQLKGYGAYLNGIYIENSSIYLDNGMTVEQQFSVMNGELRSEIEGVRNDMSLESGNILVNSTFGKDTNYWRSENEVHFINVGGDLLWIGGAFYSEKREVADIYRDGERNVLRLLGTTIYQSNANMKGDKAAGTYSYAFFYKVMRRGVLTVGFAGQELYDSLTLDPSDEYVKLSKSGKWDGTGDFRIGFTGEILIYGVSLFNDRLADAVIKLETRILQTEEYIKLLATKEYVDSETGAIYTKYDAELSVMAEEISARVTEEQFATAQEAITLANNAAKAAQTAADNANQSVTSLNTYVDGAFADGIITEAEAKAIEKYLNTVNTSKDSVTATYTKLYSNTYLEGAAKTGLKSAKDVLDSSISALISSINTAIADGKTTASEKADVDKKFAAFNTAMSSFESAVETANKYIQDKLKDYTDTATNQVKVKLESDLSVQAGQITGISTRVDNIRNEIDTAGWINTTQGNTLFAAKSLENGDNIISYINQTATTTTIKAERINLVGAVTFNMFNTDVKSTINGKADSIDLGELAYESEVAMSNLSSALKSIIENKVDPSDLTTALMPYVTSTSLTESLKKYELTGVADDKVKDLINALTGKQSTTIINGFIDTSLLNADKIIANAASIAGFTIDSNRLYNNSMSSGIELSNASGSKFIYINSIGSSSALQVRNDYGTALSIGSYDTGGVGIEVTGNTGATAIESNGPVKLITRSDEEIRMYRNDSSYLARFSFKGHKFSDYRTVINVGNLMNSNQIKTLTGKDPDGFQIRYDSQSGYIYVQV